MPGIIVGVDGSDNSRRALGWAMREAVQHHLPLTVMTVQPGPSSPGHRDLLGCARLPENSFKTGTRAEGTPGIRGQGRERNRRDGA